MKVKGIIILIFSLIVTYFLGRTTDLAPTANYADKSEYLPIFTANLYADLLIVFITFANLIYKSTTLTQWYQKYRLSAMTADILIGVLYILAARYAVHHFNLTKTKSDLLRFALLAVFIQIVLDFVFYLGFTAIPKGQNNMLDHFKLYAKEVGYDALLGDSILIVFGVVVSAFLKQKSLDFNIVTMLIGLYLVPYFIYKK